MGWGQQTMILSLGNSSGEMGGNPNKDWFSIPTPSGFLPLSIGDVAANISYPWESSHHCHAVLLLLGMMWRWRHQGFPLPSSLPLIDMPLTLEIPNHLQQPYWSTFVIINLFSLLLPPI